MSRPRIRLAALALVALTSATAQAADMPEFLRGSIGPTYARWDGFYFGAQGGESFGNADFSNATRSMINYILANTELQGIVSDWTTLGKGSTGAPSYGAFVGYNYQWNDVVMGFELNYNHMSMTTGGQGTVGPILVAGANQPDGSTVQYSVIESSSAAVTIHDVVTARLRGGWAFDRYLSYGFLGMAVGMVDISRFATLAGTTKTVTSTATPPVVTTGAVILPRDPQSQSQAGQVAYGFAAGLGIEAQLTHNVFGRAEWEFVEFPNISDFRVSLNSARAGIGVKF
jgi:opacity protein-like surface antigen